MMSRSFGFDASFADGLDDQELALTQAYCISFDLGLFTNPNNGFWQLEHGILHLTQAQSFF